MSSAQEGGDDTEENENNDSQQMDTQEPHPTGNELSSPRATPMKINEEGVGTPPQKSLGSSRDLGRLAAIIHGHRGKEGCRKFCWTDYLQVQLPADQLM